MKIKYIDLVEQTFDFPVDGFQLDGEHLIFEGVSMMELVEKYGTPLKFTYLPKITSNIERARQWFDKGMREVDYQGKYHYCYCTKSSHFQPVINRVLDNDVHMETSSAFDIFIIEEMLRKGKLKKTNYVVCNGYKTDIYIDNIARLINNGFTNTIAILDNKTELARLRETVEGKLQLGIRIASEEEPKFEFYTSRLGIGYRDIINFYKQSIKPLENTELKMLHFFINTGIRDTAYYWSELMKCLNVYVELKKICPTLSALNIGGGFPIKNSLSFDYDYEYMAGEIIHQVKHFCDANGVPEPDIFTEFGSYTVGESGGVIYSVIDQKQQNDREKWNMINSSFMTTLPDAWAINKRFLMFPINKWFDEYERVFLGGLTCDSDDYYNSEQHVNAIYLPKFKRNEPLHIGFFHTGAYQESVGGYGGIQHCLIPAPKHILIDRDADGVVHSEVFAEEQTHENMLKTLGY